MDLVSFDQGINKHTDLQRRRIISLLVAIGIVHLSYDKQLAGHLINRTIDPDNLSIPMTDMIPNRPGNMNCGCLADFFFDLSLRFSTVSFRKIHKSEFLIGQWKANFHHIGSKRSSQLGAR